MIPGNMRKKEPFELIGNFFHEKNMALENFRTAALLSKIIFFFIVLYWNQLYTKFPNKTLMVVHSSLFALKNCTKINNNNVVVIKVINVIKVIGKNINIKISWLQEKKRQK